MVEFNFDSTNFGLGFAGGVISTVAAYRAWEALKRLNAAGERAVVRTYASREADRGYLLSLIDYARKQHLLGHKISLAELLIEPRFILPPDLVEFPDPDEPNEEVFTVVPRVYDYPYLHQPYNLPTVGINQLGLGHRALVLVGIPGSGRTTALLTIALWSAGYLEFTEPDDVVAAEFESEDNKLSTRERADRVRERVRLNAERARQGDEEAITDENIEVSPRTTTVSRFREIAPMYAHLCDVVLDSGEYGRMIDPAEPLVRAMQQQAGWLSSKRLVNKSYKLLENGNALVLIDGYDDLPHAERPAAIRWMRALMVMYPDNNFIFAMPPEGYGLLMEAGAMPVYLRPWHDQNLGDALEKWQANWENAIAKEPITLDPELYESVDDLIADVRIAARQRHTLDTTLYLWTAFHGEDFNESEQMQAYLAHLLPDMEKLLPVLERMAVLQRTTGYITVSRLVDLELGLPITPAQTIARDTNDVSATDQPDQLGDDNFFMQLDEPVSDEDRAEIEQAVEAAQADAVSAASSEAKKEETPQRRRISGEQSRLVRKLLKAGVLVSYRAGRFQFRHQFMADYLAARTLIDADDEEVVSVAKNPDWDYATNYLAQMRDIECLVTEQLAQPLDVLHKPVLRLTTWLRFGGHDVTWRANLLKYLGSLLLAPHQYTLVRERVAAALAGTRDEGALVIFRRAIQSKNPDARRLGCLGAGVVRDLAALDALAQIAQQDRDPAVQIAATLALTALESDDALITVADLFELSSQKEVRRAIAESLALNRVEGYMTLYDALRSEDMMMRRAAAFGMGRIRTNWSLVALDQTYMEDDEWYVRSAAQVLLNNRYEETIKGVKPYPPVLEAPWLAIWAQEQMDLGNISFDMEGEALFEHAIEQEDDPMVRLLAAATVGQVGQYDIIDKIYHVLQDRQEAIRDAAYRTLGDIQEQLGQALPAPVI